MQRKQYSPEFKQQVVKEAREVGNGSVVARKYDLNQNIVNKWLRKSEGGGVGHTSPPLTTQDHKQLQAENEKLKKLLGKKELEIEILRDLLKKTNPHLKI